MAAHGWIGMTWPDRARGGGRPPIDRLIVAEEMITAGAPIAAMWFADRQMGPTLIAYGTPDQQAEFLPGILSGETTWCIGMSEPNAGCDLASLATIGPPRRRRVGDQRPEDLDQLRRRRRLLLPDLPHQRRGPAARGISEIDRADGHAGHRGPADHRHDHQPPLLRGVLRRRPGARGQPRRRRGRGVQADDASARARARRHRPAGVEPRAVSDGRRTRRPRRSVVRQQIAGIETGYRIGRILVAREVLRQAPAGFSAATKCFCTEHEQRVADFVFDARPRRDAVGPTSPAAWSTRPATRSWAARRT